MDILEPSPPAAASVAATSPSARPPQTGAGAAEDPNALLADCRAQFGARVVEAARKSLAESADLFESATGIPDGEVAAFAAKHAEWLERFEAALRESFDAWHAGKRRRERRPDGDASAATLSVMTPFDQEKQRALIDGADFLRRFTRRETAALGARVGEVAPRAARTRDNPFGPEFVLDAIGVASRAVYPNPRVWRPLMVRVVGDLAPPLNKIYISMNRLLADNGVLPDMKAALRARSDWRPADDKDLLPTFSRMLAEVSELPTDIVVPPASEDGAASPVGAASVAHSAGNAEGATAHPSAEAAPAKVVAPEILAGLAALAALGKGAAAAAAAGAAAATADGEFPDLDPLMALGSSTPLFATLGHWQRLDLPAAIAQAMPPPANDGAAIPIPLNLVPHIRAAVDEQVANPNDRIAIDVIALLFDYVFRDPSIPDRQRRLFGRLQVPIVKAALLDRTFFADRAHPARVLLDRLAEGAVGATAGDAWGDAFEAAATRIVDAVCRDFETDVSVFARADAELASFLEDKHREAAPALDDQVAVALAAEKDEADRAYAGSVVRDRLAGLDLPFDVRIFAETVWADRLAALRKAHGADGEAWKAGLATLDDLLWSVVVKERTAQKARLTKMIPGLVVALRRGATAVAAPVDRTKPFFDALYGLHMAALRPRDAPPAAAPTRAPGAGAIASEPPAPEPIAAEAPPRAPVDATEPTVPGNVHDFVSEMAVGTWLRFGTAAEAESVRLTWVSPMRTKYVFTSRSRSQARVISPEELAYELGTGRAALVVEPVPLFDRAVSAALDTLAARRPAQKIAA